MPKRLIYLFILIFFLVGDGALAYFKVGHASLSSLLQKVNHPSFGKDLVVGTWDDILDKQSLEFRSDNTVIMTVKEKDVPGTYTLNEKSLGLKVTFNNHDMPFRRQDDRLILSEHNVSSDVFSKRPPDSNLRTISCSPTINGVLIERGNGNFQVSDPKLISSDPKLTLLLLPGAKWTHKYEKETTPGTECIGYTRSIDEIVKDIRIRGQQAPNPSIHDEAIFAVSEVRQ